MVSAQYVKKYLTYPYKIWHTEATGQDKTLVKSLKVALSYSGGVSPTVAISRAYFDPFWVALLHVSMATVKCRKSTKYGVILMYVIRCTIQIIYINFIMFIHLKY